LSSAGILKPIAWARRTLPASDASRKARPPVVDGQIASGDQRREEGLAGIGRILAREPEGLRVRERRIAVALATVLHGMACELDVLARGRSVEGREARPLAALRQCLQPIDA
jgi:hypothetical protein